MSNPICVFDESIVPWITQKVPVVAGHITHISVVRGGAHNLYSHTASDRSIVRVQPRAGLNLKDDNWCSQELIVLENLSSRASPGLSAIS